MSEPQDLPAGADDNNSESKSDESKSVSIESHRKLLGEKKSLQQKLREFEEADKRRQEELLKSEGKLQEVLELKNKETLELRQQLDMRIERELNAKKMSAVLRGLGPGIDEKWFTIIGSHVDDIPVDADQNIDHAAVTKVVESLKVTWPEMTKKPVVGLPKGQPTGAATITYDEWKKLPAKEMQKFKPNQIV